jgi:hypothetical protein
MERNKMKDHCGDQLPRNFGFKTYNAKKTNRFWTEIVQPLTSLAWRKYRHQPQTENALYCLATSKLQRSAGCMQQSPGSIYLPR